MELPLDPGFIWKAFEGQGHHLNLSCFCTGTLEGHELISPERRMEPVLDMFF